MSVNQSGYYIWKNRKGKRNQYEINRDLLTQLKIEINEKHKSYGYHRIISGRIHTLGFADPETVTIESTFNDKRRLALFKYTILFDTY